MITRTFNTPEELMASLLRGEKWSLVAYGTVFLYSKKYPLAPFRAMHSNGGSEAIKNSYNYCDGKNLWYKVEEKSELDLMKEKYASGEYVLVTPSNEWVIVENPQWDCHNYRLIHKKHKNILDAYLINNSISIEFRDTDGGMKEFEYISNCLKGSFIDSYNESFEYRLKHKKKTVYIIKFFSTKGKVLEMDKSKLTQMPKNIINEYEIEVHDE